MNRIPATKFAVTLALQCIAASQLSGCAFMDVELFPNAYPISTPVERQPVAVAEDGMAEDIPFRLEVINELNDGDKLIVRGRVIAKAAWELSKTVVRLTGLTEEGEVRNAYFPLGSATVDRIAGVPVEAKASLRRQLPKGEKIEFSLELPAENLASYQLELLWGNEAEPILKKAATPKGPAFLALRQLEVQLVRSLTCDYIPCPSKYQLTGELFNSGGDTVTKVVIGAGFVMSESRGKLALSDQIPENEQLIEIRNISLAPGEGKPVKVVLDQEILESEGRVKPVIRIVSFETEP